MKSIESLQRQLQLIGLEKAYDQRALEEAFQAALQHSHLNSGCWYPLRAGKCFYNALNQLVMEVEYAADHSVGPDSDFEPSKRVTFFYISLDTRRTVTRLTTGGTIQHIEGRRMQIALDTPDMASQLQRLAEEHDLGVRLDFDDTTYQVMEQALLQAKNLESEKAVHLRETLIGGLEPQFRTLPQVAFPQLNQSQNEAVQRILEAREVAVVHGPPGTGKTTTLVEAIIETTRREPQVLVCAPSNAAVDWISEKLIELRTQLERNFLKVCHGIQREYRSMLNMPEYLSSEAMKQLYDDGVDIFKNLYEPSPFLFAINLHIKSRINNCRALFPEWLKWEYLSDIFIMPGGDNEKGTIKAAKEYYGKMDFYPYRMYMNWPAKDYGNILFCDW